MNDDSLLVPLFDKHSHIFDVPDVIELERKINASGTPLSELMNRAGRALAYRVHEKHSHANIVILCGNGNNGGDGWVAAAELAKKRHPVSVICARLPRDLKAQPAHDAACAAELELERYEASVYLNPNKDTLESIMGNAEVIVDALLGTGFTGETVKGPFDAWISVSNVCHSKGTFVYAADVPSGLNAQNGSACKPTIIADETITMIVSKTGLELPESQAFTGAVGVASLVNW